MSRKIILVTVILVMTQAFRISIAAPQNYVLSFSWQNAFCSSVSGRKTECAALQSTAQAAQYLSLHGVWPKRQYCDVPAEQIGLDKKRRWKQLPALNLSDKLRARLERDMPGTASGLERHEWVKHGSCSGVSAEAYFQKGVDLTAAINRSGLGVWLNKKVGKRVALSDLQAQIASSFGVVPESSVEFLCYKSTSRSGHFGAFGNRQNKKSLIDSVQESLAQKSSEQAEQALIELRVFVRSNDFNDIALDAKHLAANPARNPSRARCVDGTIKILEDF